MKVIFNLKYPLNLEKNEIEEELIKLEIIIKQEKKNN